MINNTKAIFKLFIMKIIRIFSRLFTGAVFMFSGFVKAVDPLGTTYKFSDYFEAFHIDFLNPFALVLAIMLCTAELVIGINLLLGIRMKITSWVLLVFMTAFTAITLKLAISNPVTDCGCFGDAIILTNWQTFWKNIILFVPALVVFMQRDRFKSFYDEKREWMLMISFVLITVAFSLYNYNNLPLLDFRPYHIGAGISEKMIVPEGSPADEYKISFVYEKNGKRQEFTYENLPDSTWSFVDRKQKLIKKGYVPPIHDFSITTLDGDDITRNVLDDDNYTFLIVAYDLQKADKKSLDMLSKMATDHMELNHRFICLTSSTYDVIQNYIAENNPAFELCSADNITLKTIVRANPGLVLLKEGVIIGKWHNRNIPAEFRGELLSYSLNQMRLAKSRQVVYSLILGLVITIMAFHLYYKE